LTIWARLYNRSGEDLCQSQNGRSHGLSALYCSWASAPASLRYFSTLRTGVIRAHSGDIYLDTAAGTQSTSYRGLNRLKFSHDILLLEKSVVVLKAGWHVASMVPDLRLPDNLPTKISRTNMLVMFSSQMHSNLPRLLLLSLLSPRTNTEWNAIHD
jgi:hypothetical protein